MEREQIFQNTLVKQYGLPLVEGSLAGLIATVPMTIFMLAVLSMHREGEDTTRSRTEAKALQMLLTSSFVWLLIVGRSLALLVCYPGHCWRARE